jgi:Phage P22-like portal protein
MAYGIVDQKDDKKDPQARLAKMKANIERTNIYWKPNAKRFHKFQKFCFKTAITVSDESALDQAQKPVVEFNIVNAPLSRQCGEFSKQEPSIEVSAKAGKKVDPQVIEFLDGHIRYVLDESKKRNTQYNIYRDSMSGGFSNFKLLTEYEDETSFDQIIKVVRCPMPTMIGYDPMAREADKSDAEFYFELFPMEKEQFKREYPDIPLDQLDFLKSDGTFNWSFKNQDQYVIVLADYYEKVKTKKTVVKLANYASMLKSEYEEELKKWESENHIEQPPAIIEERESEFVHIRRSRIMQTTILEEKDTLFKYNNLVYVDGDSVIIQDEDNANMEQFTKPYVYHAEGLQRLINFTGQVIANDFENMVMHKFMIAEEALPTQEEAQDAWTNVQQASLLVHKAFSDINPDKPLPIPQAVNRVPLPPEVMVTFNSGMQILQNILGSYDASLAQNDAQLSGVAIVEAATLSNGAAMPYVINYMQSLTTVANCIVDLLPKLTKNKAPREFPVIQKDGKKKNVKVNHEDGLSLQYDSSHIQVNVEAGVNFAIAKNKALQQLTLLMKISPEFAEFMNEMGLETLLDNIEFRNSDILRAKVDQWKQMKEQKKAQQPDPEQIKAEAAQKMAALQEKQVMNEVQKTQLKGEEISSKATLETERLIIDKEKADNDRLEILMRAGESKDKVQIAVRKAEAEEERARADLGLKTHHQHHTQFRELGELAMKHHTATKEKDNEGEKE